MSKKVLIVTKIGKNYGALLQAYALKRSIEKLNCEVQILNYALQQTMNTYRVLPRVTGISTFIDFIKSLKRRSVTKKSVELFLKFREDYFDFTEIYHNYKELKASAPEVDIYFSGSDQVWNPTINFDPAYYLMFGKTDVIRASYAASIGRSDIPDEYKSEFVKRVKAIQNRSVREESAKHLLDNLGLKSIVHIDPTLLLCREEYDEIINTPYMAKPYVLLYLLIMPQNPEEYIVEIRKKYPDHDIVSIPGSTYARKIGDLERANIGPREFLGLIRGASAVLTSSFHGTVFSVIYEKNFMSILPTGTGSRISGLLLKLKLEDRIASLPTDIKKIDNPVDFLSVRDIIKEEQTRAYKYLQSVVND